MYEILRVARDTHETEQNREKRYADWSRRDAPAYKVGDHVFVNVHALSKTKHSYASKFAPKCDKPIRFFFTCTTPSTKQTWKTSES